MLQCYSREDSERERERGFIFFIITKIFICFFFFISYLTNKREGKTTLFSESKNFVLRSLDCNFKFDFFFQNSFLINKKKKMKSNRSLLLVRPYFTYEFMRIQCLIFSHGFYWDDDKYTRSIISRMYAERNWTVVLVLNFNCWL